MGSILKLKTYESVPKNYAGIVEYTDGYKEWYLNGQLHRVDGPAIEWPNGSKAWYLNGQYHRVNGPAVEWPDGTKWWYLNGQCHRVDGPAVECPDGSKLWYLNNKQHREDGPAYEGGDGRKEWWLNGKMFSENNWKKAVDAMKKEETKETILKLKNGEDAPKDYTGIVEWPSGAKAWYLNGNLHREDGPAIESFDGSKSWWLNGKRHREDGPAYKLTDGTKYWCLNGKHYSNETEWKKAVDAMKKEENKETILKLKNYEVAPENYTGIAEWANGTKVWFLNGERHRVDGPAIELANGVKEWYLNGEKYSNETQWKKAVATMKKEKTKETILKLKNNEDVPENYTGIVEWASGSKEWYLNGELHRVNAPACEYADGSKSWYSHGKRHREDGPAYELADGSKEWWVNGERHREDGPAYELADGTKKWFLNGERHREDGPAVEWSDGHKEWWLNGEEYSNETEWKKAVDAMKKEEAKETVLKLKNGEDVPDNYTGIVEYAHGTKKWYLNGELHRVDGPAVERANGSKEWWLNGKLHRVDGPAYEDADGSKDWYLNGKLHREDGPAIERADGTKKWYLNGELHREDGPAVEWPNGSKEWWLNGEEYSNETEWKNECEKTGKSTMNTHDFREDYLDDEEAIDYSEEEFLKHVKIKIYKVDTKKEEKIWYKIENSNLTIYNCLLTKDDSYSTEDCFNFKNVSSVEFNPQTKKLLKITRRLPCGTFHSETDPAVIDLCWNKNEYQIFHECFIYGKFFDSIKKVSEKEKTILKEWFYSYNTKKDTQSVVSGLEAKPKIQETQVVPVQTGFKSEIKHAGVRVACRKSVKVAQETLVSLLSAGKSKADAKRIRDGIATILNTEMGKAGIGYLLGAVLPQVQEQFPEKYQAIMKEFGTELRIEAMAVAGEEAIDVAMPILGMAKVGLMGAVEGLMISPNEEKTRVEVSSSIKVPQLSTEKEDVEEISSSKKKVLAG